MKNTKVCPKCQSDNIVRILGESEPLTGAGNNIRTGWTHLSRIPVTRYLCADCGFSEEWIDSPSNLTKLADKCEKYS